MRLQRTTSATACRSGLAAIGALAAGLALAAAAAPASAGTLLSEDFSAGIGGTYGGAIPNTQFHVTEDNIDLIGMPSGSPFSCSDNPGGNCLDLVGNEGGGAIASNTTFNLLAGDTYTVKFGANLQGFDPGVGSTTFTVGLGSLSQTEVLQGGVNTPYSISFKALADESDAALTFATVLAGDGVHGAVIDNIVLSESGVPTMSGAPEPGVWALMLTGFGAMGGAIRARRRRQGWLSA
jgi:hypothetical protein